MLHIVTGAPCSGKSTYVEEHRASDDLVVDYDKIAKSLGSINAHDARGLIREAAFAARDAVIDKALETDGAEAWIIHTFPTESQLARYTEAGAEIIKLDIDKETALERARADGRPQTTIDGINRYFSEEKGNNMQNLKKEHRYKTLKLKADENGIIEGYFSTYDEEPDSYGDIIKPGAFTETIKKREETGHPFPLCFNHDFSAVIGAVDSIKDTDKGPYIKAHFLDTQLAQDVRKMLLSGAIYQFSFAYDALGWERPTPEQEKKGIYNVLTKLDVFEISVVTVPANQNAVATEVKSAEPETKAGRRNSKADEDVIKQIRDLAQSLLDEDDDTKPEEPDRDPEEAEPEVNAAAEEQKGASNSERVEALLEKIKAIKGGSNS